MRSFAELLCGHLQNELIEVYSGDNGTTRNYADYQETLKEVIRGTLMAAEGELLVLEVEHEAGKGLVYVNAWNVRSVCRVKDGTLTHIYQTESPKKRKAL